MAEDLLPVRIDESGPHAGCATLLLEQVGRPVVVLDGGLIERIERTVADLPSDLTGLVLASASERVFVAGADLKAITELDDAALHEYLAFGSKVFALFANRPYPTVAAINGAALGGGLEIAMHCDALVAAPGAKPYPVGLPEAGLAICPGWGGTNLLAARMSPAEALRRTAQGKPLKFDEAVEAGLFDEVVSSQGALLDTAKAHVMTLREQGVGRERDGAPRVWIGRSEKAGAVSEALDSVRDELSSTEAGRAVLDAVGVGLSSGWDAALKSEQSHLVRLRHTLEAREAIRGFFEKSGGKG